MQRNTPTTPVFDPGLRTDCPAAEWSTDPAHFRAGTSSRFGTLSLWRFAPVPREDEAVTTIRMRAVPPAMGEHQRHSGRRVAALSHLDRISALRLVDCMPVPTLVIGGDDGDIVHLNTACLNMLGHRDGGPLLGRPLTEIAGARCRCARLRDQIELLHHLVGSIMTWQHAQGHDVSTVVSPILEMRLFDPLLVVGVVELTAPLGGSPPPDRTTR